MTLEDILALMLTAHERGQDVARVHSGDPSIYGAIAEQMRRLDAAGVDYAIVPGVPAYAAAAASLKRELTLPEIAQSVVITRMPGGASAMPPGERLEAFARTGATLAIHLAIRRLREIVSTLTPHYGSDCPVAVVYRASWPDELVLTGTLEDIQPKVREAKITRTALVLVGPALAAADFQPSRLYAPDYQHILRHRGRGRSDSESGGP
jgi:precorrin-4/cobalt-precorrin-4 C11-methyltransferase